MIADYQLLYHSYLKTLIPTFDEEAKTMIKVLMPLADGKTVLPLKKHISQLASDIISKVSFFFCAVLMF